MLFKQAGVDFEDVRIEREAWPSIKDEQPLKALPVLEINGKKVCQSAAIARYLAKEFGLMGATNKDQFRIDELQETYADIMKELIKIYYEKDEEKKKEMTTAFVKDTLPKFLDFFEMRLKENNDGSGFYVGDELSLGDLVLYNGLSTIQLFASKEGILDTLQSRPLLQAHYDRIAAQPKIADWIKHRPQTEM